MSERAVRAFLSSIDPSETTPETAWEETVREVELQAWYAAVNLKTYVQMFRAGALLATNIYGEPYAYDVDTAKDSELSDRLGAKVTSLRESGLLSVIVPKPNLDEVFPQAIQERNIGSSDQDHLREKFGHALLKQCHSGGFRDIAQVGAQGYLDKVPDQIELFTYCAPNGTKTFVTNEGYVGSGFSPQPDFERPLSQRGAEHQGFIRSSRTYIYDRIDRELDFLRDHNDRFEFDDTDLLGYRPADLSEAGAIKAWYGLR